MPKQVSNISDADLKDRLSGIDPQAALTARQAAIVLICSTSWLEEARKQRRPPPWFKRDPTKAKSSVFYLMGDLLAYREGLRVPLGPVLTPPTPTERAMSGMTEAEKNALKRAQKRLAPNLLTFLTKGQADDEYPFTAWKGELIDFFDSLTMNVDDSATCGWYTLDEYLTERRHMARRELREATVSSDSTLGQMRKAFPADSVLNPHQVASYMTEHGLATNDVVRSCLLDGANVPGLRSDGETWKAPISSVAGALDAARRGEGVNVVVSFGEHGREARRQLERREKAQQFWGQVIALIDQSFSDAWLKSDQPRPTGKHSGPL